jgi:hypothetical protein
VHLPKDFSLNRQQFRQLFPNYRQFLELKKKADPEELFQSDMYRRFFRDAYHRTSPAMVKKRL